MSKKTIFVCKHVLTGEEPPRRIFRVVQATDDDSGFNVTCGRSTEDGPSLMLEEAFYAAHPDLLDRMSKMSVGDKLVRIDTEDGSSWQLEQPK